MKGKMGYQLAPITNYYPPQIISMISTVQDVPLHECEDFLRQKFAHEGLSAAEISRQTSSARSTVASRLKEFKIECDPLTKKTYGRQLGFGERLIKGCVISHKAELEIIGSTRSLRDEGKS